MYASRPVFGSSALYARNGIPADSADCTGLLNAVGEIRELAMPSALPVMALLIALTISPTLLVDEPVHVYEQPSSLHASAAPFWVGVKKMLVVTWLTRT